MGPHPVHRTENDSLSIRHPPIRLGVEGEPKFAREALAVGTLAILRGARSMSEGHIRSPSLSCPT